MAVRTSTPILLKNNQAALVTLTEMREVQQLKYVDLEILHIKRHMEAKRVHLRCVQTNSGVGHIFTKLLQKAQHWRRLKYITHAAFAASAYLSRGEDRNGAVQPARNK